MSFLSLLTGGLLSYSCHLVRWGSKTKFQKRHNWWRECNIQPAFTKFNNRNTRKRCEIYSKFTPCSSVSIVNFDNVIAGWESAIWFIIRESSSITESAKRAKEEPCLEQRPERNILRLTKELIKIVPWYLSNLTANK